MFVDKATITIQAGRGGDGLASFRREKYIPRGGPNGGDGGRGGDVILVADPALRTLLDFRYRRQYRAGSGAPGAGQNRHGASGDDLELHLPPGTLVKNATTGETVVDLVQPGERIVIARGGRGGRGNARFVNSVHRAPRLAERGEPGEELSVELELKLLAEVGLVGFPNAGKSTLLSRISAARPAVGAYPFTTLEPQLGVVYHRGESYVVADIPGLLAGAHEGVGLGQEFLRHIERTRVLLFVLDAAGTEGREPLEDYRTLEAELRLYSEPLATRRRLVAANKIDLPAGREAGESLRVALAPEGVTVIPISGVTGQGLEGLLDILGGLIETVEPEIAPPPEPVTIYRPQEPYTVTVDSPGVFRVRGAEVERRVAMTDPANDEAVARLARYLKRSGIEKAVRDAGANPEAVVLIRDQEFEFSPEE